MIGCKYLRVASKMPKQAGAVPDSLGLLLNLRQEPIPPCFGLSPWNPGFRHRSEPTPVVKSEAKALKVGSVDYLFLTYLGPPEIGGPALGLGAVWLGYPHAEAGQAFGGAIEKLSSWTLGYRLAWQRGGQLLASVPNKVCLQDMDKRVMSSPPEKVPKAAPKLYLFWPKN